MEYRKDHSNLDSLDELEIVKAAVDESESYEYSARMKERIAFSETGKPYKGISVIFPAYNEEDNVERAVAAALGSFRRFFDKIEIIVVDDGSKDKTSERLDALAESTPEVVAKHHAKNRGYGAALRTGIEAAQHELIFFSDSDLQFDLDEIELLLEWIDHHDIVTGYRAKRADPMIRKLNAWAWGTLVKTVLGVRVKDIDCAFKLFHRHVFDGYKLESVGAMINTEILARAKQNKMTIKEVPVNHYTREVGEQTGANIKVIFKAFRELVEMHGKLRKPQGAAMDLAMNKK